MPETCPECGEPTVYLSSDKKRKLCISCKYEEAMNGKNERLLYKKIRELPFIEFQSIDEPIDIFDSKTRIDRILDECNRDHPLSKSGKATYGDPLLSEHERLKIAIKLLLECERHRLKWFGDVEK